VRIEFSAVITVQRDPATRPRRFNLKFKTLHRLPHRRFAATELIPLQLPPSRIRVSCAGNGLRVIPTTFVNEKVTPRA
jgi:hypothetical protein